MKINLACLCDAANISSEGKLNMLGIFNLLRSTSYPYIHPAMTLVFRLNVSPSEFDREHVMEIQFRDPDGKKLLAVGGKVVMGAKGPLPVDFDQIVGVANLVVPKPGPYSFLINVNGNELTSIPLEAIQVSDAQAPQAG